MNRRCRLEQQLKFRLISSSFFNSLSLLSRLTTDLIILKSINEVNLLKVTMLPIGRFTSHITIFLLAFSNLIYLIPSSPLVTFKVMFFLQIFQLVLIWQLSKSTVQTVFKYSFIIAYILSRGILAFKAPILEDDYYRYLWDGQVFLSGINPYQFAPLDEKLDLILSAWRSLINYPDIRSYFSLIAGKSPCFASVATMNF